MRGTYILVVGLDGGATIRFSAAGRRHLPEGSYAYVGSAFGAGGLDARIERHREVASGARDVRYWHIDHLTGHPPSRVLDAIRYPGVRVECDLARALPGEPVPGLGASDCGCATHLVRLDGSAGAYSPSPRILARIAWYRAGLASRNSSTTAVRIWDSACRRCSRSVETDRSMPSARSEADRLRGQR